MVTLSNFTSVFEISAAIHLAYSLLREIHEREIVFIEKQLSRLKGEFEELRLATKLNDTDVSLFQSSLWLVDMGILLKLMPHQLVIKKLIKISVFVSMASIVLLVISGFYPDAKLSEPSMMVLLVFVLAPMPIMLFATNMLIKSDLKEVRELLWRANREICEFREKYRPRDFRDA